MSPASRAIINRIMADVAEEGRQLRRLNAAADLTSLWMTALERVVSTIDRREMHFPTRVTPAQLKRLCHEKPWSFERFEDYVNQHP